MQQTNHHLETIVKGAGIIFIGIIISKLLGYIYRLIIARLGTEDYGLLSTGLAFFGVLVVISFLGMGYTILRYVSYYKSKEDKIRIKSTIISALKITLPFSILIAFLLFFFSDFISIKFFHNIKLSIILKIFAIAIPLDIARNIFLNTTKALQKVQYEVYSKNIAENIIKIILTLILITLGLGIIGATIAYVISILISTLLALYFLEKKVFPIIRTHIKSINLKKELISYSWPLLFSSIVFLVILWIDTLMIGYFKTMSDVGIYNAALPTAQLMYVIPYSLITLFLPVLTGLYSKNKKEEFKNLYIRITKWILLTNIVIFSIFLLFSKSILKILFGQEYITGYLVLIILALGYLINYSTLTANNVLLILKKTKSIFVISVIGALSNIILNIILIPKYSILGASIATSLSFIIMALALYIFAYSATKINFIKVSYLKILISSLIPIIIINMIAKKITINLLSLILLSILFLIIYITIIIIIKALEKEDMIILKMIKDYFNSK